MMGRRTTAAAMFGRMQVFGAFGEVMPSHQQRFRRFHVSMGPGAGFKSNSPIRPRATQRHVIAISN